MAKASELLPVPGGSADEKRVLIHVSTPLYEAARAEMRRRKVKVRDLFKWALVNYLRQTNPAEAARLGLS